VLDRINNVFLLSQAVISLGCFSGTAASFCQREDWSLETPRSESVAVVVSCDRRDPFSRVPVFLSIAASISPARRSAQKESPR